MERRGSVFIAMYIIRNQGMATAARKSKASKIKEDDLTPEEIQDVKQSLKELKEGKGKKFKSVQEMLAYVDSMPDD